MQLILPFSQWNVPERHVQWLASANAGDYPEKKFWFYPFKSRFCREHGVPDGMDLQVIEKKCWCGDGIFRGIEGTRPERFWEECNRCGGSGIFETRHVVLLRWRVGDRLFHEPSDWVSHAEYLPGKAYHQRFEGLIRHPEVPADTARRSMEKLMFRYEPQRWLQLWQSRWRAWQWARSQKLKRMISSQIRHVNELLARVREEEAPF